VSAHGTVVTPFSRFALLAELVDVGDVHALTIPHAG
jgi:hypothetical protein